MEINDSFRVSTPIEDTWKVLLDIEGIAPCLPGAQLQEVEGDEYRGIVKVKVGPIAVQYKGAAVFVEKDDANHRAVLKAEGRDTKGAGNASALITAQLQSIGDRTKVAEHLLRSPLLHADAQVLLEQPRCAPVTTGQRADHDRIADGVANGLPTGAGGGASAGHSGDGEEGRVEWTAQHGGTPGRCYGGGHPVGRNGCRSDRADKRRRGHHPGAAWWARRAPRPGFSASRRPCRTRGRRW